MRKTVFTLLGLAVTLGAALLGSGGSRAQTVQGDILRGQGRFLEGAGWYNLNTARADRINVETWKQYNREVQRLYRDYMVDRYQHLQYKKGLTGKLQREYQRKFEEAQRRWRTAPTLDDITSGDALNALAGDLADPSVAPSSWRLAKVDLPPQMSLTALAFKLVDKRKSTLSQSTIAVDRMLVRDGWPLYFRRPEIDAECKAYEKAVAAVVEKCRKGAELQASDYDRLRAAVSTLQKTVETAIPPTDNQRSNARAFVRKLDDATKLFAEQSYAEQLVRDVSEHKATTVAELLAFMRQYRLLFSEPNDSPEVAALYEGLYGLLRQQKDALGIRTTAAPSAGFQPGSVWVNVDPERPMRLSVVERNGDTFRAMFEIGKNNDIVREVHGQVGDDSLAWRAADVRVIKAPGQAKAKAKAKAKAQTKAQGGNNNGVFKADEIHFTFNTPNGELRSFVLRKAR
jgi:hypothetical protein